MTTILQKIKTKMMNQGFLRKIILVKIIFVALLVYIYLDRGFQIGDKKLEASTDALENKKAREKSVEKALAAKDAGNETKSTEEQTPTTKRKSFIDNLLNLPDLDPNSIKKEELGKYLSLAEKKKQQIEDRLSLLREREEQLIKLEMTVEEKLGRLDEERLFFAQTIQREKELKDQRIDKLITLYEKMEPKKAAPMFEKMDKDLVVALFKRVPQKQITSVMEAMDPAKSVELSEYFGRVKSAREYDLLKEMNKSLKEEFDKCKGLPPEKSGTGE